MNRDDFRKINTLKENKDYNIKRKVVNNEYRKNRQLDLRSKGLEFSSSLEFFW